MGNLNFMFKNTLKINNNFTKSNLTYKINMSLVLYKNNNENHNC